MRSSYKQEDVTLLLKDITGLVSPQDAATREAQIQAGRHYSEMLPLEYAPSERYMETYRQALDSFAASTAHAVGILADRIVQQRGKHVVLVSLARAGTPVGILLRRYLTFKYGLDAKHYSISIIRGRGIDKNALAYILDRHAASDLLFVDGWVGKGAILGELEKSVLDFPSLSPALAVLADPANITALCGTHRDILIPSSCLNCTVSGLVSRTFLRDDIIGPQDFHGAVYYEALESEDLSEAFLSAICAQFRLENTPDDTSLQTSGLDEVLRLAQSFCVPDINLIKPGIGETTRVLLRRVPFKVLVAEDCRGDASLSHVLRLAEEKQVPVLYYPLQNYKACGIIASLADA